MPLRTSCSHKEELFCCAESNGPEKKKRKVKRLKICQYNIPFWYYQFTT